MNQPALDSKPGFVRGDGQAGQVYNEAAFRYFLVLERKRAERARRHLWLILVSARMQPHTHRRLAPQTSEAVFLALGACVREVDLVGWFRDRLAAAALLPISGVPLPSARQALCARVTCVLQQRLANESARLQVRVIELDRKSRT